MQLDYSEQEKLERGLFIDIILLAPATSELVITADSWQGTPDLLGERLIVRNAEWVVPLLAESREFLQQQALLNDLQTMFVHFYIVENGMEIFSSFDRMCSIVIEDSFPESQQLKLRYATLEIM
ncbi:MAG: hypothetical protein EOO62_14425 [Hymenobacter sp.]|nr:MAG: hypothetical protein EOO62_14425 [Hymenobacter sp.]